MLDVRGSHTLVATILDGVSEVLENLLWIRAFCLLLVYFVCPFPLYLRHVLFPGFKCTLWEDC